MSSITSKPRVAGDVPWVGGGIFSPVSVVSVIFGGHHEQNKLLVLWMITRFSANLVENLSIICTSIGLVTNYVDNITFLVFKK